MFHTIKRTYLQNLKENGWFAPRLRLVLKYRLLIGQFDARHVVIFVLIVGLKAAIDDRVINFGSSISPSNDHKALQ